MGRKVKTIEKCCAELLELVQKEGGVLAISYDLDKNDWSVGCEFGKEDEDSPIFGGAVYGASQHLSTALNQAVKDLR